MRWLMVLFISGCSGAMYVNCDFDSDGVCVITNGYDVSAESFSDAVDSLANRTRIQFTGFDLHQFIHQIGGVVVTYHDPNDMPGLHGLSYGKFIDIAYWTEGSDEVNCFNRYYPVQHELLHIVSVYYLGVSSEENRTHNVDHVFIDWALGNGYHPDDTIEGAVYHSMGYYCGLL